MKKKFKITLIIITLLSIGIGSYFITRYNVNEKVEEIDTKEPIIDLEKLQPSAGVSFKVGQRFEYKRTGYDKNGTVVSYEDSIVTVEGIEKIDDNDYYVVYDRWNVTVIKPSDYTINVVEKYYYDTQNGNVIKIEMTNKQGEQREVLEDDKNIEWIMTQTGVILAPWMLYLSDTFMYRCKYGDCKIKVIGREWINDREVFILEIEKPDCKSYSWIDVEKRILIKQKNICNSITYEKNLISGI